MDLLYIGLQTVIFCNKFINFRKTQIPDNTRNTRYTNIDIPIKYHIARGIKKMFSFPYKKYEITLQRLRTKSNWFFTPLAFGKCPEK